MNECIFLLQTFPELIKKKKKKKVHQEVSFLLRISEKKIFANSSISIEFLFEWIISREKNFCFV